MVSEAVATAFAEFFKKIIYILKILAFTISPRVTCPKKVAVTDL